MIAGNRKDTINGLIITIILGIIFTMLQAMEYLETSFTIADSVYGTTFFVATGFHGLHVIIGTIFLIVSLIRIINHQMTKHHHNGYEASIWY
jgi:heme/copper-type cytochrome/quinol oxidase subunit 3